VYGNRRRIRGRRGRRLTRQRGERIERSFAHLYDTGGMRRTHLRGHENILKRLLIHAGGFNLGLLIRASLGVGTPRGLQGAAAYVSWALFRPLLARLDRITVLVAHEWSIPGSRESNRVSSLSLLMATRRVGFTTGC
jgi:transposase